MVYFLGDWGMGDSDCASLHQHVPNTIQQQYHHHHQQQHRHHQHEQQQQQQIQHNHQQQHHQQQHVGQIAPNLNQLSSPIQFGTSTTGSSSTFSSHSIDTHTVQATATTGTFLPTPQQNVATSSLVTANLQQLSVSSNNLNNCSETPLKSLTTAGTTTITTTANVVSNDLSYQQHHQSQLQQSYPLASAAAALHQYLGHQRQRSESCAGFTTAPTVTVPSVPGNIKNADGSSSTICNNSISAAIAGTTNCNINIKNHLGSITSQQQQQQQQPQHHHHHHQQLQTQLSKDHLESEDEVALQPLSNQVNFINLYKPIRRIFYYKTWEKNNVNNECYDFILGRRTYPPITA